MIYNNRLGNIATYINGYAFKPTDWCDIGKPIIRIQDLTDNSYQMNRFNGVIDSKYNVKKGDVLISWSASLGVYEWQGEDAVLNQHIFKVVFDKVEIDKRFFVYQTEKVLTEAQEQAHGATMKHLTKPVFDALPFYLPSLDTQKDIAKRLEIVRNLISKSKEQINLLDDLVKSQFIEMFGDPITNSKSLSTIPFINVVKLQRGFDLPIQNRVNGIVPVYGSNGVLSYHNECKAHKGVITGRSGTIGNVYYEDGDYWPLNTTLFSVDLNGNEPIYVAYLLKYFKLERFVNGTGVPTLNRNIVHNEQIINVDITQQKRFARFVEQTDKSKFRIKQSLEKLEICYKALLQKYFG